MKNQSNYQKVNDEIISKLNTFFALKLNDEVVDAMVEDLGNFSRDTLRKAFVEIRRNCKKMPSLAEILHFCKKNPDETANVKKNNDARVVFGTARLEDIKPDKAREILGSDVGQYALQLGVGMSLIVEYERSGKQDFSKEFVLHQKNAFQSAIDDLEKNKSLPCYTALANLLNTMQAREKKLKDMCYLG